MRYLIAVAPHALVSQRQKKPKDLPSLLAFLLISTDLTPSLGIPIFLIYLKFESFESYSCFWHVFYLQLNKPPNHALRQIISDNACSSRFTAAAGTRISQSLFVCFCQNLSQTKELYDEILPSSHSRDVAESGFRPLLNSLYCCLSKESRPCLSPSVADHSFKSTKDRRLGALLPHQQPNLT